MKKLSATFMAAFFFVFASPVLAEDNPSQRLSVLVSSWKQDMCRPLADPAVCEIEFQKVELMVGAVSVYLALIPIASSREEADRLAHEGREAIKQIQEELAVLIAKYGAE